MCSLRLQRWGMVGICLRGHGVPRNGVWSEGVLGGRPGHPCLCSGEIQTPWCHLGPVRSGVRSWGRRELGSG